MKSIVIILTILITLSMACSFSGLTGGVDGDTDVDPSGPSGSKAKEPPAWFVSDGTCRMEESMASSKGSPYAYDQFGNLQELLPDGKITCVLEVQVCGDTIFKQQVIDDASQDCPQSLHFSSVPTVQICCDTWEAAKQSGSPCNPYGRC
jgi:hypothetical protein